jgi:hypothetical protein
MSKDREQALRAEVRLEAGKTAFRRKTKRGKRGKRGLQKAKITTQGENQAGIRVFSAACLAPCWIGCFHVRAKARTLHFLLKVQMRLP